VERLYRAAQALGIGVPKTGRFERYIIAWAVFAVSTLMPTAALATGGLSSASLALSDPRPGQTSVNHVFTGSSVDGATAIKCVMVVWSTTSGGDTAPAGFSGASGSVTAASSTLINSSSTNWSLAKSDGTSSAGQNNIYKYTNSAGGVTPSTTTNATFVLAGITNPTTPDTAYFFKLNTYTNTNCSTGPVDNAAVGFIVTSGSQLSLTIDPTLSFTVNAVASAQACDGTTTTGASSATDINFGSVTPGSNNVVCQDLTAATNAAHGYSIYVRNTGALTNGGHNIADHTGTNGSPAPFSSPGTESYGYTTNDSTLGTAATDRFTNPSQGWAALTTTNEEIAFQSTGVSNTTYRIGHQAGISVTTPAGVYQTTVIYTCTPIY
jgi:hypothetical protein